MATRHLVKKGLLMNILLKKEGGFVGWQVGYGCMGILEHSEMVVYLGYIAPDFIL
jgi:hypothetical protein